jgi:hypothetical protein
MAITAEFVDGPARGTLQSYPDLSSALPSVWWSSEGSPRTEATYHRMGGQPDPLTGLGTTDWNPPDQHSPATAINTDFTATP